MNEFITRLSAWWQSREPGQQVRTVGVVAATVIVMVALSMWASSTSWRPVASGSQDEMLTAAGALEAAGIPYNLETPGQLLVPASRLGGARTAITAADVMPGLSDVSELKLGLTPKAQEWALVRAREGDLARMINGIDGIAASQVQIVARQDAFFLDEQRPARASVFVRLEPGADMGSGQVRAIRSLVSSAVDGLDPEQVTLADDRGTLLARADMGGTGDPADLTTYRRELEAELESSVITALLPVLGSPAFFSVAAGIELDMTSSETVSKQLAIQEQAVLSEQIQESQSDRTEARGVPGVDANLPEAGVTQGAGSGQTSERSALVTNYAYPTVDEIRRRPAGGVDRVSVAVQVDSGRIAEMIAAGTSGLTMDELRATIDGAVRAAANVSAARQDLVQVSYLPFATVEWEAPETATMLPFVPETVLPWAVAAMAVALGFLFVVRPVMAAAMAPVPKVTSEEEKLAAAEVAAEQAARDSRSADHQLADRLVDLVENFEPMDTTLLNQLVENQSVAAAQVLRQWNRSA